MTLSPVRKSEQLKRIGPTSCQSDACGKAIIVGEHAVVYGARAIAMPISRHLRLHVQKLGANDPPVVSKSYPSERIGTLVADAFEALDVTPFPIKIEGESSILVGSGLGSSSALCTALLRAIAQLSTTDLPCDRLAVLGNLLERRFHGTPSGLDTAVVAHEQTISFRRGRGPRLISTKPGSKLTFVLVDSRIRSSTISMIKQAAPYFASNVVKSRVMAFDHLADMTQTGLEQGDASLIGTAMNKAQDLLKAAGVVTPALAEISSRLRDFKLLGAKITGAGGGGCLLGLLDPKHAQEQQIQVENTWGADRVITVNL